MEIQSTLEAAPFILLVDDEPSFCVVMGIILKLHGYSVRRAHSAKEAIKLLEERTPDLILADVMMPDIDGLTMIKEIRSNTAWSYIPTVVVSARTGSKARDAALDAGADAFIGKPFTSSELQKTIHNLLYSD
jgi:DNA-binding response OmpR family regulator